MHTANAIDHRNGHLPDTTEPAPDNSGYDSAQEFPPGYVDRANALVGNAHRAGVKPLPGPLLDAFLPPSLKAAGLELRPVVASDWAILQRLDSPLLKEINRASIAAKNPEHAGETTTFTDVDVWDLVLLWTRPPAVLRALLAKGLPEYHEAALRIADELPASVIADSKAIIDALVANLLRSLATQVGHEPAGKDGPDFRLAPPQTASAGGSVTSGR